MSYDPFAFLGDIDDVDDGGGVGDILDHDGGHAEHNTVNLEDSDVQPACQAPGGDAHPADTALETIPREYQDFYEFMVVFIGPQISRKISEQSGSGLRWDPDWWRYPEAVLRADLMWRSYEGARIKDIKDPGALEAWMRLVCDHHLGVLLNGQNGPMSSIDGPMPTLGATYPPDHEVISVEKADTEQDDAR